MEADEHEYEERLAQARKREAAMRRMTKARVVKKAVSAFLFLRRDNRSLIISFGQKLEVRSAEARSDEDDEEFLPEPDSLDGGEDMNIPLALRVLMAKSVPIPC